MFMISYAALFFSFALIGVTLSFSALGKRTVKVSAK